MGEFECAWDFEPVDKDGDTCDEKCYRLWYGWLKATAIGNTTHLQPDDRPPKPIELQPWRMEEEFNG